jgi:four helix bundle protein
MVRYLQIARGSAAELEYHALLARDLHLIPEQQFHNLSHEADELQRMLTALARRFKSTQA